MGKSCCQTHEPHQSVRINPHGPMILWTARLLFRHRKADANRHAPWFRSRNDAVGNIAVPGAALGVFGIGQPWPDLLVAGIMVAGIMAGFAIWGGLKVFAQARTELAHG